MSVVAQRWLPAGAILKVTAFAKGAFAGVHDHAWMVVRDENAEDYADMPHVVGIGTFIPDVGTMSKHDHDMWFRYSNDGTWLIEDSDEYEIVPNDKVPGEVWAAFAVWKLLK